MRILDAATLDERWQIYHQDEDETGSDAAPGHLLDVLHGANDGVDIHFWQRDADIGPLNPPFDEQAIYTKLDILLAGKVDIIDSEGCVHPLKAGQAVLYRTDEVGRWEQRQPIVKIGISLKNFRPKCELPASR